MKWVMTLLLVAMLTGCAHSVKEANRLRITEERAAEIGTEVGKRSGLRGRMFVTAEPTKDGWRVFLEEAEGRKRSAVVRLDAVGEVEKYKQISP